MQKNLKQITFDDATREQLMDFAVVQLGLNIHKSTNTPTLIAKIKAVYSEDFIVVQNEADKPGTEDVIDDDDDDDADEPLLATDAHTAADAPNMRVRPAPKVTLRLHLQEGPGGRRPLPVTVNGSTMLVPRGEDVSVPYYVYEALRNAVQTVVEYETDENKKAVEVAKEVSSYPFDVKRLPSDDEVAAWKADVDKADAIARKAQQDKERAQRREYAA